MLKPVRYMKRSNVERRVENVGECLEPAFKQNINE